MVNFGWGELVVILKWFCAENDTKSKSVEDPSNFVSCYFVRQVIDQEGFLLTFKIALPLVNDSPCDFSPLRKNLSY